MNKKEEFRLQAGKVFDLREELDALGAQQTSGDREEAKKQFINYKECGAKLAKANYALFQLRPDED